jgi:hypothetical protein
VLALTAPEEQIKEMMQAQADDVIQLCSQVFGCDYS